MSARYWRGSAKLATEILPPTTAGIHPEKFSDNLAFASDSKLAWAIVILLIALALGLRLNGLGTESLGEDELNKLQTVEDYRANGLTGRNGEHPFLMKGLQTASVVVSERIKSTIPTAQISDEAALRFPVAVFGSFTTLLIFLLISELFGRSIGLISAGLWALEPMAIGFDRVAKEDSLVLFFFLLTSLFWVRSQTCAERGDPGWTRYAWATAAAFAALMASKYYPSFLGIVGAYYIIYRGVPGHRWEMRPVKWLIFFAIMGFFFLILNPTIMLPETWREMLKFSSENRIGHDSYEYLGTLYRNQMSAFLNGVPWTFFFVFAAVKTSLSTLLLFAVGLPLMLRRRLGDGRFFIFFWAFFWLVSYTFIGGKFTRYFTSVAPVVMIVAAVGFYFGVKWLTDKIANNGHKAAVQIAALLIFWSIPLANSLTSTPNFRLFTNALGGGQSAAGTYFPHDEFYDLSTREVLNQIILEARSNAVVACETSALFEHYAKKAGRSDLRIISLSDRGKVTGLAADDYIVAAEGRRYMSNSAYLDALRTSTVIPAEIKTASATSARIYRLDESTAARIREIAKR